MSAPEQGSTDDDAALISEVLPAALDGERLDRVVALLADVSRADAKRVLEADAVRVDGELADSGKVRVSAGQQVEIDPRAVPGPQLPQPQAGIDVGIVHVDDHIIVIDKPPGLVVHPGAGNPDGTLVNALLDRFGELADVGNPQRPGIVHRLDAGSSGLLVVARTEAVATALIEQFATHAAGRRYRAVVWGTPEAPHGVIDAPLGRSPSNPLKMAVVIDGRHARTEYRVIRSFDEPAPLAELVCELETGRTHQIRVHLASIGHPLVGDGTYSGRRPSLGLTRPFLHAEHLAFVHPGTGESVAFDSPLADDLATWLAAARESTA